MDRIDLLVQLLKAVAVAVHQAADFVDALQNSIDRICTHLSWPVAHVYLPAADGSEELISSKIWHLANPAEFSVFRQVTEQTRFPPGKGLPGRVLVSGTAAWIPDVTKDGNFPRNKLAADLGVRSGFAFPVLVEKECVAVMEFYSNRVEERSDALMGAIDYIGTQLGFFFAHRRVEVRLKKQRDFIAAVMDLVSSVVVVVDRSGKIVRLNRLGRQLLDREELSVAGTTLWSLAADTEGLAGLRQLFTQILNGAPSEPREAGWTTRGGERRLLMWSGATIGGDTGEAEFLILTGTDITDTRRAEQERATMTQQLLAAQAAMLDQLSTPLIPISDEIMVMPLIGVIDSVRANRVIETLADGVTKLRTSVAILDVTGVVQIDSKVADALIRASRVVKLLGAQVVVTGIGPAMARSLLGSVDGLDDLTVCSSLQKGITYASALVRKSAPSARRQTGE